MKVILKEDVNNIGNKGEVVEVADGHARNYLLPKGLAVEANDAQLSKLKAKKKAKKRQKKKELEEAKEKANKIEDLILEIPVKAGEMGKLFGSVTTNDIADAIYDEIGIKIDKRKVELDDNIKTLGTKKVEINLHKDVSATVKVKVTEA
ncbi:MULTISPECIES: 50S ribosomal protein L9 [unclassified Candidatus Frackibacter]|uniref:50S ribosomal protein L9 n=1 Tax=unclassified Candidatus Frackibacter TaxID=2648818 RepID=UPI0007942DD6|nr:MULTISPECIES: 50S ribosomal protein L9 [unclassified Candidatus Frackibacter]KXS40954.1 MAG: large subunit ribosomal protein L9 [Candidatus Frackibacter sp. T328-2]SDC44395.1 LSU ribosomal protein L9P [Candidatus Frackibacter sp. WG11]SEM64524.1 LSU ribosomal protein L9P [Candidatus Frackibacter sp. WG12]SFL68072.1 LSU ribosomal protein L9P [Candidatus Frackibacter sp. WG13]